LFKHHQEKKAYQDYQAKLAAWQEQRDAYANLVTLAQTYAGEPSSEIMLKPGEAVFATVTSVALVEDRRGAGEWQGRSQGFSIPVASIHGRSIRYRVGSSRGHFVQGAPAPAAIDVGTAYITTKRVIFQGAKQTRECLYDKLVGFRTTTRQGEPSFRCRTGRSRRASTTDRACSAGSTSASTSRSPTTAARSPRCPRV
jgi:hypothetical protein